VTRARLVCAPTGKASRPMAISIQGSFDDAAGEPGWSGPIVCDIVGITYRQLDYWDRTDLLKPSLSAAQGSGTQRLYSYVDLVRLKIIKGLLEAGVKLQTARKVIESLRDDHGTNWQTANLVIDGANTVLARDGEHLVDLVRRGQGVLNVVAVGSMVEQLDAAILALAPRDTGVPAPATREQQAAEGGWAISEPLPHEQVRFAHNSERQFAKLLDFYNIEWQYEPRTFTLEHDREGRPVQAFTPDFYLPAYDLYIEITTLNQKLVTKKNRKARRLVELHPEVQIKVLYQRDYLNLLVKYGLEAPSQLADEQAGALLDLRPTPAPMNGSEAESA
jgi:DNA-binding transcriptional MerR regulator